MILPVSAPTTTTPTARPAAMALSSVVPAPAAGDGTGPLLRGKCRTSAQRHRADDDGPLTGRGQDLDLAVDRGDTIAQVGQSVPVHHGRHDEPVTVVADLEAEVAVVGQLDLHGGRAVRVLARVLQCLHAREVHGCLDLRPMTADRDG